MSPGYVKLQHGVLSPTAGSGEHAAPTAGETKTLWVSNANVNNTYGGAKFKRLICNIYSSHASVADGLKFEESNDGSTWRTLVNYSVAANTYTKNIVATDAPFVRVRYANPAVTLTAWEMSIYGDHEERGNV